MADIVQKNWNERQWMPTETAGVEYSALRAHASGGATFFLRFASGTQARPHNPNEVHDAQAHVETVLLLNTPKLPVFL